MPSDSRLDPKFLKKELVSMHHIINHVLKVWACLIMHTPSGIDELEATFLNELLDLVPDLLWLLVVPHREELHLDVGELAVWLFDQLFNDSAQNQINLGLLIFLIRARVVLVHSF